jgi:CO dehydrogenase maturation factor
LGVKKVSVVANKVRGEQDEAFIRARVPADELLGMVHLWDDVRQADMAGRSPYDTAVGAGSDIKKEVSVIKAKLDSKEI